MGFFVRSLLLPLAAAASLAAAGESPKLKAPGEEARGFEFNYHNEDTGELEWKFQAAKVAPDPANPRAISGTKVRIQVFRSGKPQTASADKGTMESDGHHAVLEGNVTIELDDVQPTRVETEDLAWDGKNGVASTRGPVKISRVDMTVTGRGARMWLTQARDKEGKAERTGHLVIEQRIRVELLPGANTALLQAPGRGEAEPIVVTCDGPLAVYRSELTAHFSGNVRAVQGKRTLTCERLVVSARAVPAEKGKATLESAVATGNVRLDDGRTIAVADSAAWSREEGSLRLAGRPAEVRWDNGNRLVSGLIHRMGDGAELHCTPTQDYPQGVYLLAQTTIGRGAAPDEKAEPFALQASDILDWPAFCTTLAKQGAAKGPGPGRRLWEMLPPDTQGVLQGVAQGNVIGRQRKAEAVRAINAILSNPAFCRQADFAAVPLSPEAKELLRLAPDALGADQVRRLNRLLLEAAFPGLIAKAQEQRPQ